MKSVETLIRLHRWQLDERRRVLKDLEEMRTGMEERLARLSREIEAEQARAASEELRFAYGPFARQAIERRQTILRSIEEIAGRIEKAREDVAEAYREAKKYERLEEEQRRRDQVRAGRLEQRSFDEAALAGFERRRRAS
ncbi:MAG: flagellar FliJ family protein [Alphaproteobacteria bacterium]|nr:flagellar FliJ family protein [Alphaproteobacteria bacterium]